LSKFADCNYSDIKIENDITDFSVNISDLPSEITKLVIDNTSLFD
jgi:hypothetical protein